MQALSGAQDSLPMVMTALAIFGVGIGIYIASNNNETMAAAPVEKSATAGGLVNLFRIFGGGVGVAASAALLAGRLELAVGNPARTSQVTPSTLLSAVDAILLLIAVLGAVGAVTALVRDKPMTPRRLNDASDVASVRRN
jgi:hypothetical protein